MLSLSALLFSQFFSLHPTGYIPSAADERIPQVEYRKLSVAARTLGGIPSNVDLTSRFPTPGDQVDQGACVAFALGYALQSAEEKDEFGWNFSTPSQVLSPSYIYNQVHSNWSSNGGGTDLSVVANLIVNQGVATLAEMPFNGAAYQYSALPSIYQRALADKHKASGFFRFNDGDYSSFKRHIAAGHGVAISIPVYSDFDNLSYGDQVYDRLDGAPRGWHAITLIGYDDGRQAFKFINSWGTSWGVGGYGWISYYLVSILRSSGYGLGAETTNPYVSISPFHYSLGGVAGFDLLSSADRVTKIDYNGDHKDDLILYRPGSGIFFLAQSLGAGIFSNVQATTQGVAGFDLRSWKDVITVFDYNGDGKEDILLTRVGPGEGATRIGRSNGDGTFSMTFASSAGLAGYDFRGSVEMIQPFDFNGDGMKDLLMYRPGQGTFWIARSNGDATFTAVYASFSGIGGFDMRSPNDKVLTIDINGDRNDDLLLYRPGAGAAWVLLSNGNGSFSVTYQSFSGIAGFDLLSTSDIIFPLDFNGDNRKDLLIVRRGNGQGTTFVAQSIGDGTFTPVYANRYGLAGFAFDNASDWVWPLDYTGDGKDDLFFARTNEGTVYLGSSNGDGSFTNTYNHHFGGIGFFDYSNPINQTLIMDQDGNGHKDLFMYQPGSGIAQLVRY
ncbi:MAG: VCBS repeat-containing protein [Fibrobacteres bacterium]|nr:VCBS repeat-containing protein [Fibrobacterota bacterium]